MAQFKSLELGMAAYTGPFRLGGILAQVKLDSNAIIDKVAAPGYDIRGYIPRFETGAQLTCR